ncbi:hypothetical protein F511_12271 [Dorcoceras hygrometricum]|uniref:Uncharacterized protein n=1 Tax=Dorcoceras hygrometricum TaxID=472368 RepID=A0A2Z7D7Z5_9LAMI|nr:hypothetical protein F511_12271 [Dorcoceras hygrometricum]
MHMLCKGSRLRPRTGSQGISTATQQLDNSNSTAGADQLKDSSDHKVQEYCWGCHGGSGSRLPARQLSRGNRHFTIDCGRLRQSGPRSETGFLRQPALEGLTRSVRMDSHRQDWPEKFSGGGGGGL